MSNPPTSYHLPFGARNPEKCRHPSACNLGTHVYTEEEAEQLRAKRDDLAKELPITFTKSDLPLMRRAHALRRAFRDVQREEMSRGRS